MGNKTIGVPFDAIVAKANSTKTDVAAAAATLVNNTASVFTIGGVKTHVKKDSVGAITSNAIN